MYCPYESERVMSKSALGFPRNQDCLKKLCSIGSQALSGHPEQRHPEVFMCLHDVSLITIVRQKDPCLAWIIE